MKNWKYIDGAEVGNELTSYEKAKKSDLEKRLRKEEQLLADAKKMLGRKMSDDDRIGFEMQKEECEKNVSRLKEELRKIGNSKTNNTDMSPNHLKDIEEQIKNWEHAIQKVDGINKENAKKILEGLRKERQQIRDNQGKKTGNYKTGTSKLKPGDKVESYGVKGVVKSIKGENEDNIYGEPLIEVEFNSGVKKVVPEHYLIKVGNSKVGNGINWDENLVGKTVWVKDKGQEWRVYVLQDKGDKIYVRFPKDESQGWVSKTRVTSKAKPYETANSTEKLFYGLKDDAEKEEEKSDEALDELKKTENKYNIKPMSYKADAYRYGKELAEVGNSCESNLARARNAMEPIKYKGYTIKFRPNSQKYYISSGPGDTYVREYAYKEYASAQDAKDAIDHLK